MRLLPLATEWETLRTFRGEWAPGTRMPRPEGLLFCISAIGELTLEGIPVTYGAIAVCIGNEIGNQTVNIADVVVNPGQGMDPGDVMNWLTEQAWKAAQALGYYRMRWPGKKGFLMLSDILKPETKSASLGGRSKPLQLVDSNTIDI